MKTDKTRHAVAALEDHRAASEALLALNRSLVAAGTACRAIVQDACAIGDGDLKKAARRLLRTVNRLKEGPNKAVWADLNLIEEGARAVLK